MRLRFFDSDSTRLKSLVFLLSSVLFMNFGATAAPAEGNDTASATLGVSNLSLTALYNLKVESASFFSTDATRAPGTILVIPAQKIKDMPVFTLENLLQMDVPGVQMSANTKHGPVIGMRGILSDQNLKTLVMLDGQHINIRRLLGYMGGLRLPFLGDYKSIEVIKGPGAIMHGSGAISGFINLVPKTGDEFPGWDISLNHGFGEDLNAYEIGYGKNMGDNKSVYFYTGYALAEGFENSFDFNGKQMELLTRGASGFSADRENITRTFAYPKPTYKLATYLRLQDFNLNAMFHRIAYSNNSYDNEVDPRGFLDQSTLALGPKITMHLFTADELEISTPFEAHDYSAVGTNGTSPYNRQRENVLTGKDSVTSYYIIDTLLQSSMAGGSESHYEGHVVYRSRLIPYVNVAVGGLAGQRLFWKNKNFFSAEQNRMGKESIDATWNEYAGFSEAVSDLDQLLNFPLTVSGGLRYDYIDYGKFGWPDDPAFKPARFTNPPQPENQDHISPRIAMSVSPIKNQTFKASYQEGFNYPAAMMFAWVNVFNAEMSSEDTVMVHARGAGKTDSSQMVMNGRNVLPALKPELLKSLEADYHGQFWKNRVTSDVAVFFNSYENPLMYRSFPWTSTSGDLIDSITIQALRQKYGWLGAYTNGTSMYKSIGFDVSGNVVPIENKIAATEIGMGVSYVRPFQLKRKDDKALKYGFYTYDADAIKADVNGDLEAESFTNYPALGIKGQINQYFLDKRIGINLMVNTSSEIKTLDTTAAALGGKNWYREPDDFLKQLFSRRLVNIGVEGKPMDAFSVRFHVENLLQEKTPPPRYNQYQPDWGFLGYNVRRYYLDMTLNF